MPLSWNEIKSRAMAFSRQWADAADEKQQSIPFWIDFFDIFGITNRRVASFEHAVDKYGGKKGYVDLFWPGQMLVEQKSAGRPLEPAFDQAMGYFPGIAERDLPHTLVVCDFQNFRVIDLDSRREVSFALKDLHRHVRWFGFIAGYKAQEVKPQDPVNVKAAERMGRLHDALKKSGYAGHPLEVLLVRLLFCLFADDTAIFPAQGFRAFIEERTAPDGSDTGPRLAQLFQVLNTSEERRNTNLDEQLRAFPYVNGRLFDETLPIADFDAATREALLDACALDWSSISPAIFGSLFQSIMDETARRNLGAHYTSEENILKLIGPLFLDELRAEFHKVKGQRNRLFDFHKKLRSLSFFDPACGCGNFLVISYRELRLLELDVLRAAAALEGHAGQRSIDVHQLIGVNVDQFFGIEIEEFPAQIAQVALWLVDHQMNLRVSEEFGQYFARIPLVTSPRIVHGNALTLDWNEVLPAAQCSFVLGNPPFSGKHYQSKQQKADALSVYDGVKSVSDLDLVAAWFVKAAKYIQGHDVRCAFVATNSLTQGEQVPLLWPLLFERFAIRIHFAHRTFQWRNEARGVAAVHCVIVGFACSEPSKRRLFEYETPKSKPHELEVSNINAYLLDGPNVIVTKHSSPISPRPGMGCGSKPSDGGHLILDSDEKAELLGTEPQAAEYIKPFVGSQEFLNGGDRWCLWLEGASPSVLKQLPSVLERLQKVRKFRLKSTAEPTRRAASTPGRFFFVAQPASEYLAIPEVSSERRTYVPIGYLSPDVIASNKLYIIEKPNLYVMGLLQSSMHAVWMRTVGGRLESRIQYSGTMVYNTFPWPFDAAQDSESNPLPVPVQQARAAIESAAQGVLDARAQFAGSSLADLYDPLTMPPALLKAHQRLDAAVDKAYQLAGGPKSYQNDAERVAFLFTLYQRITSLLPAAQAPRRTARRKPA